MMTKEHHAQAVLETLQSSSHCFIEAVCLPFLIESQNPDGGWGYQPGSPSSVEATAWALTALTAATREGDAREAERGTARGIAWLHQAQRADGSWPAFPGPSEGCWSTSLACLALLPNAESAGSIARGLKWLINARPAGGGWFSGLMTRLSRKPPAVQQNNSLKGWSWVPRTASWVEPTAYALILLKSAPATLCPPRVGERIRLANRMLYDRMCPGGGWNSGNPLVYGVSGIPRVGPTVWALLALRQYAERAGNRQSLKWLEDHYSSIRGPASLALAHLGLTAYGQRVLPLEPALWELYRESRFLCSVLAFAWAAIALGVKPAWATPIRSEYGL